MKRTSNGLVWMVAMMVAACSTPTVTSPTTITSPTTMTSPATTVTSPATTVTSPTTTVTSPTTTVTSPATTVDGPGPTGVEVYLPDRALNAPAVVLVHGGSWVAGTPGSTAPLATSLSDAGAIVFNASYRTALTGGGYPATFDDIACAVRYARSRLEELGGSGELILAGHSAGAQIAAIVALSRDAFAPNCPWTGSSTPDRLVGLAGLYQIDAVAPVMDVFLGGNRTEAPDAWEAADPFAHLEAAAGMDITLVHGTDDEVVPPAASVQFAAALEDAGANVDLELVDGAGHMDMVSGAVTTRLILP